MFYPFLVADPRSGLHYRLTDTGLAELSLAPKAQDWAPGRVIAEEPHPVWQESLANAPVETMSAVSAALEGLVLATADLRVPSGGAMGDSRAGRHLDALIALWRKLGDALPEGLAAVRHVLDLPHGRFLDPLPVVEESLDPHAPAAMKALYGRLKDEFGAVAAPAKARAAREGSRLHALQGGVAEAAIEAGPKDGSLAFYGLRDVAACADFAAARAGALIESGIAAREIAVLASGDPRQIARAFAEQGVPISGLPASLPERDIVGETALQLALAKRTPTPAMVLASLALSPLMPWSAQTGRDLAESIMNGDFRGDVLSPTQAHKDLWTDMRASAGSLAQLRFLIDRICERIAQGNEVRARLSIPPGEGSPDWEAILRGIQIASPSSPDPERNFEGVSLWSAHETPWRQCRHLIITDFTDGRYPTRPRANPLFLDSEITAIRTTTGLQLRGRAEGLAESLFLFDQQLQAVAESVTFLVPWRDLSGVRQQPSAGLSLVARAISDVEEAHDLILDLSRLPPGDWPVAHHRLPPLPESDELPEALSFPGLDLLALRRKDDGTSKPQSPSRLETLLVSPLAWLLDEVGAGDMSWSAEELDVMAKGNIAHDVFEHVFLKDKPLPEPAALTAAVAEAYDRALTRHAGFLRSASWEMERSGLEREILQAALRWREHLLALGAKIIGNEIWLAGEAHGINLHGKADAILELPDGTLLVVDHKKSGTSARRRRMEAGWDLQAGLYRDMLARPIRRDGDGMDPLIGRQVGIAYHLMNDGGLLTSGHVPAEGSPARDMGDAVNDAAVAMLAERLAQLGAGRVVLNTSADEGFFKKEAGFTPYALTDGSTLVTAFIRQIEEV
ncbi:PD-(D/E)XK nuclease family protein [Sulfitobacter sp. KE29]|uniref:PD-(D/E)XK nuclease family protein n=1 Tax=unclassified Sulfitobacter TaxID=196795 RepID=UPI0023E1C6D6|nr:MULTISPECIES: PD-(D/E)XK nuclease family protein [unclassified Sulfitobacter]MDF3420049.1 PD-(D/E)XK nuclease family protein [Sulfitobacter sp. Ks38]MDF3427539.1 PD-(D/E)XK nuclease family protein [Sulfitobacter sp. KE29]MDF3431044.1 PD-(D/E)XK nuclease family protein [Sulfitobacter sp. S46]MDF3445861.1 PD-(D/E)XK nuclease family protein [Sulfitobacter sp. KE31]MDF3549713.1 PD-(D/E)XK nuclease family protein [Sulfitobacter sp. KE28]